MHNSRLITLSLILLAAGAARAEDIASLGQPEVEMPVLKGRLLVRMPEGAKAEPRGVGIMEAGAAAEMETRIVLQSGKMKVVLMASELASFAGEDFTERAKKQVDRWWKPCGEPFEVGERSVSGLKTVRFVPTGWEFRSAAALCAGAYVLLPDRNVVLLAVYANREAGRDPDACKALADAILSSAVPGSRALRTDGGRRFLRCFEEDRGIDVDLHPGWIVACEYGVDFLVYRLIELTPLGEITPTLGVYMGGHPSSDDDDEEAAGPLSKEWGSLLGNLTRWTVMDVGSGEDKCLHRVATIRAPEVDRRFFVQVFMTAPDAASMARLRAVSGTMRYHGYPRLWPLGLIAFGLLAVAQAIVFLAGRRRRRMARVVEDG